MFFSTLKWPNTYCRYLVEISVGLGILWRRCFAVSIFFLHLNKEHTEGNKVIYSIYFTNIISWPSITWKNTNMYVYKQKTCIFLFLEHKGLYFKIKICKLSTNFYMSRTTPNHSKLNVSQKLKTKCNMLFKYCGFKNLFKFRTIKYLCPLTNSYS